MLSLGELFLTSAAPVARPAAPKEQDGNTVKRPAPFSIRLTRADRARLAVEAAGAPLGAYIKAKLLGSPVRARRTGLAIRDSQVFAQLIALLGNSRAFQNLSELNELAQAGALPFTPEIEAGLLEALADIGAMRGLLLEALGLKPDARPASAIAALEDA